MALRLSFLFFFILGQLSAQEFKAITSTKDPRAKGLDFMLEYPASWTQLSPDRPNVVMKIFSPSGSEGMVVLVKKLPGLPDKDQLAMIRELMATAEGLKSLPGQSKFISGSDKTVIDNLPSSTLEYYTVTRVLENDFITRGLAYTIFYKDYFINIMFSATDTQLARADAKYLENELIFKRMAASFILLSRYNK